MIAIILAGAMISLSINISSNANTDTGCLGEDFDLNPDLEFQLNTTSVELVQILGHIGVGNYLTLIDNNAITYHITGDLVEELEQFHLRRVIVIAKVVNDGDYINEIDVIEYELLPYSVVTGNLSIETTTCKGIVTECLILSTFYNDKEFRFHLIDPPFSGILEYLEDNFIGDEITISGVIGPSRICGKGDPTFMVHSICQ